MSFDLAFIGYKNYFTATASTLTGSNVSSGYSVNSLKIGKHGTMFNLMQGQAVSQLIVARLLQLIISPLLPMNYSHQTRITLF